MSFRAQSVSNPPCREPELRPRQIDRDPEPIARRGNSRASSLVLDSPWAPHFKHGSLVARVRRPFDSAFWGDDWIPSEALALPDSLIVEAVLSITKSAQSHEI